METELCSVTKSGRDCVISMLNRCIVQPVVWVIRKRVLKGQTWTLQSNFQSRKLCHSTKLPYLCGTPPTGRGWLAMSWWTWDDSDWFSSHFFCSATTEGISAEPGSSFAFVLLFAIPSSLPRYFHLFLLPCRVFPHKYFTSSKWTLSTQAFCAWLAALWVLNVCNVFCTACVFEGRFVCSNRPCV